MYVSTALRGTAAVRSTRVSLLAPGDSAIGTVFPVDPVSHYPKAETLGHRPLRKRRINRPKPSFSEYLATDHQVDEYV
jgi:hypothetical protein